MRKKYTFTSPGKAPKKKKKTEKIDDTDDKVQADSKPNDYHHYRYCPVDGCTSLVKRITPHLKKVHNLKAGSDAYIRALSRVWGPIKESHMAPYHKGPRKSDPEEVVINNEDEETLA